MDGNDVKVHHVFVHLDHEVKTRLESLDQQIANMQEQLREVLNARQDRLDAAAERLERANAVLQAAVDINKPKEGA